jgi:transposase
MDIHQSDMLAIAVVLAMTIALFALRHLILSVGKGRWKRAIVSPRRVASLRLVRSLKQIERIRPAVGGELLEPHESLNSSKTAHHRLQ